MTRPVGVVVALMLAALSSACTRGGDDAPAPSASSVPSAASSSTSPVLPTTALAPGADPFAIPEVIDAAYVNRVLEALYAIDGDITREVLRTNQVGIHALTRLGAVYREPQLSIEVEGLPGVLEGDRARFRSPVGDRQFPVRSLLIASASCIVAVTDMSLSAVAISPPTLAADEAYLIALVPRQANSDREELNPTPWLVMDAEIVKPSDIGDPRDACG